MRFAHNESMKIPLLLPGIVALPYGQDRPDPLGRVQIKDENSSCHFPNSSRVAPLALLVHRPYFQDSECTEYRDTFILRKGCPYKALITQRLQLQGIDL